MRGLSRHSVQVGLFLFAIVMAGLTASYAGHVAAGIAAGLFMASLIVAPEVMTRNALRFMIVVFDGIGGTLDGVYEKAYGGKPVDQVNSHDIGLDVDGRCLSLKIIGFTLDDDDRENISAKLRYLYQDLYKKAPLSNTTPASLKPQEPATVPRGDTRRMAAPDLVPAGAT